MTTPPMPETMVSPEEDLLGRGHLFPAMYKENAYMELLPKASRRETKRLLLGLPVTGLVRVEFMFAKESAIIPTNWSHAQCPYAIHEHMVAPLGYDVKDARNYCVQAAVTQGYEWLFFLDHDVIVPPDLFIKLNAYMHEGTIPIVSGLYTTKSDPAEPLVYRGRGTSYYRDWKLGEKVWVDGTGCGCLLLSVKLLRAMWEDAPEYVAAGQYTLRRVFETPFFQWVDPEAGSYSSFAGTEDLSFFDRVREGGYLKKTGFTEVAKKKYFICMDSSIFCMHIDQSGTKYPKNLKW